MARHDLSEGEEIDGFRIGARMHVEEEAPDELAVARGPRRIAMKQSDDLHSRAPCGIHDGVGAHTRSNSGDAVGVHACQFGCLFVRCGCVQEKFRKESKPFAFTLPT